MKPKIIFLLLTFSIIHTTFSIAEVRYVSKTGSSTPPYTSWETAADSIQKAIDVCLIGDTIIVANGLYSEKLVINKFIYLIGLCQDSCVIDGSNELSEEVIRCDSDLRIENFTIKSRGQDLPTDCVAVYFGNITMLNCYIQNARNGVILGQSSPIIQNCMFINCKKSINTICPIDTCQGTYLNNIIVSQNSSDPAILHFFGGSSVTKNNLIIGQGSSQIGVSFESQKRAVFKNNLVSGFQNINISVSSHSDTVFLINNNSMNVSGASAFQINQGDKSILKNNIIQNANFGISGYIGPVRSDYNLFNNVNIKVRAGAYLGDGNIIADPMFVNDTLPRINGTYDLHLQKYSPAIDAGDPNILDVDGSRSDIGMFGGPLGQKYTYMDLAPKPPRNLTASLDLGLVHLKWNKNTEADLFRYRVYRDTVPDFIYDITKIIATVSDTFYYDDVPDKFNSGDYYYKLTAIDTAVNQSAASEEVHVSVTGIPEAPPVVVEHYRLLQNYPNPFNPSTIIPYRLKESGYVKIMVYNLVGELVRVLVNQHQGAGYYEVEFNPNKSERKKAEGYVEFETGYYGNVASGIYLYRIEVIGEGRIPVYSDMKKMILIK